MTFKIQVLNGNRYTLWNVTNVVITQTGAVVEHNDRPNTHIQGFIESAKRVDTV